VVLIFAISTPKSVETFIGANNHEAKYFKVNNYLLFSVCKCTGCGTANYVTYFGVLGMTFKVASGDYPIVKD
jgi:hypothetical protein